MLSAVIPAELSYPAMDLAVQLAHQGFVLPSPLVLKKTPRKFAAPTAVRDRPGSRRAEPSSRTTLMDEQSNPWDLLQPQDVMSRHRGRELLCRYGLSRETTLLSLEYL